MPLNHLFVDFNAFFASCEQHLRPELRGRPLGIVVVPADTACCIAASYEAKAHGVKTGMLVREARRLCPGLIPVESRPAEYVRLHHRLRDLIEGVMHVERVLSIDELSCRLTGAWREPAAARALALRLKAVLRRELGPWLRCSIGLAPNLFLAKTASDMQKPDGLTLLDAPDLPHALHRLELRDLSGIGPRLEQRLRAGGITTVAQLTAADRGVLRAVWGGIEGERFWGKLRGYDVADPATRRVCFGHSHVLAPELRTAPRARAVLHRLLQKAAVRLRADDFFARELQVHASHLGAPSWDAAARFDPTDDTLDLLATCEALWAARPAALARVKILRVAVTLAGLEHVRDHTRSLFQTAAERRAPLQRAADRLNLRYGYGTVYWAGAHEAEAAAAAPMRIPFTRIPDLGRENDRDRSLPPPRERRAAVRRAALARRGEDGATAAAS